MQLVKRTYYTPIYSLGQPSDFFHTGMVRGEKKNNNKA